MNEKLNVVFDVWQAVTFNGSSCVCNVYLSNGRKIVAGQLCINGIPVEVIDGVVIW